MKKFSVLTMMSFVCCLAAAGCQSSKALTTPCDVLVRMDPKPETNAYIVANDRPFAQKVASHRGRYQAYKCEES